MGFKDKLFHIVRKKMYSSSTHKEADELKAVRQNLGRHFGTVPEIVNPGCPIEGDRKVSSALQRPLSANPHSLEQPHEEVVESWLFKVRVWVLRRARQVKLRL